MVVKAFQWFFRAMPITRQTLEEEYRKNPDIKREDIAALKEWTKEQYHLPEISELELLVFYHSCYLDMEVTKITIDKYFTMRTNFKLYFADRDPHDSKVLYTLDKILYATLPLRTKEGYKVIYVRFLDTEPSHFFYDDSSKIFTMLWDLIQAEEGTFPGLLLLSDLDGVGFGLIGRLGLLSLRDSFAYLQEALPVRLKGFHILNTPTFMNKFLAFLKPFMNKELVELIHLHPAPIDTIFDYVPKKAFPKEMGGEFDSYDKIKSDLIARLQDNSEFFINEEKRKVDESKRPKSESSGLTGFFKRMW